MLARPIDPTSCDGPAAAPAGRPGPARLAAFGLAQRHSRRVRVLKLVLPLAAATIAVVFPVYSYLATPAAVEVKADGSAYADGKLVMSNPKLNGFTSKNLPYSMTAVRAIQDPAKQGIVELEDIEAELPIGPDNQAAIGAAHGIYDRDGNTLELDREITVSTTDGLVAKLKSAFLDIGKGNMKTEDPVDITRKGSRIMADTMTVEDNGKVLIFEKRVRVNIDPAGLKAANDGSGEPNASQ